jgi:mono/diheme cytochrome c family protein
MRLLPVFLATLALAAPIAPKKPEPQKPLTPAQKADYAKVVQPIFDAHCVSCHGPKKENSNHKTIDC